LLRSCVKLADDMGSDVGLRLRGGGIIWRDWGMLEGEGMSPRYDGWPVGRGGGMNLMQAL